MALSVLLCSLESVTVVISQRKQNLSRTVSFIELIPIIQCKSMESVYNFNNFFYLIHHAHSELSCMVLAYIISSNSVFDEWCGMFLMVSTIKANTLQVFISMMWAHTWKKIPNLKHTCTLTHSFVRSLTQIRFEVKETHVVAFDTLRHGK